jgi:hypothetical protein
MSSPSRSSTHQSRILICPPTSAITSHQHASLPRSAPSSLSPHQANMSSRRQRAPWGREERRERKRDYRSRVAATSGEVSRLEEERVCGRPREDAGSPFWEPTSPSWQPVSPLWVPRSPSWEPVSPPFIPRSPSWEPVSPSFVSRSPLREPVSPSWEPTSPVLFHDSRGEVRSPSRAPVSPQPWASSPIVAGNQMPREAQSYPSGPADDQMGTRSPSWSPRPAHRMPVPPSCDFPWPSIEAVCDTLRGSRSPSYAPTSPMLANNTLERDGGGIKEEEEGFWSGPAFNHTAASEEELVDIRRVLERLRARARARFGDGYLHGMEWDGMEG